MRQSQQDTIKENPHKLIFFNRSGEFGTTLSETKEIYSKMNAMKAEILKETSKNRDLIIENNILLKEVLSALKQPNRNQPNRNQPNRNQPIQNSEISHTTTGPASTVAELEALSANESTVSVFLFCYLISFN